METEGKSTSYEFSGYRLDSAQRRLAGPDGNPVVLRSRVFDLLDHLVAHRGRVVSKSELLEALWPGTVVEENNLNQAVSALRQALGDDAHQPRYIATLSGRGYQFIDDVRPLPDSRLENAGEAKSRRRRLIEMGSVALVLAAIAAVAAWLMPDFGRRGGAPVIERFDAADKRLVTDYPGAHAEPVLSPDGSMMAWVGDAAGMPQIWVRNLQSGDPIQLTHGEFAASSPSWSPSNNQILFARHDGTGRSIYSVGPLGTPAPRPIVEAGQEPSFALAHDRFVFTRGREIWIADSDGRNLQQVQGVPGGPGFARRSPALSPDGSRLAFIHADEGPIGNLWVLSLKTGEPRQLTAFSVADMTVADSPVWTPDGRAIVYTVLHRMIGGNLWVVDVESAETSPLTTGPGAVSQPSLSRDGERLAYTHVRATWQLSRFNPVSGDRGVVFQSRHPILVPDVAADGRAIAFFSQTPSGLHVFTIGSNGRDLQQRTFDEHGENTLPFWSSDGRSILYYRGRALHRVSVDDGRDERVFDDFHWSSRNWPAARGNELYFYERDRSRRVRGAVIRNLETGTERKLDEAIAAASWSRDGNVLVGHLAPSTEIRRCDAESLACSGLRSDGEAVSGFLASWSRDGRRIFFLRRSRTGDCCAVFSVTADGRDLREHGMLDGYDVSNSTYDIDANGHVVYNHSDRSADEIWIATVDH